MKTNKKLIGYLLKKNPELAAELLWDSRIAFKFEHIWKNQAQELMERSELC